MLNKNNNIIYPVVQKDIPGGVWHPLPYFDVEDWRNKNRHPWDEAEISRMMIESFGSDGFQPAQFQICCLEYDATNQTVFIGEDGTKKNLIDPTPSVKTSWQIARIIRLGIGCFSTDRYPLGAEATIGDYVMFEGSNAKRTRFKNERMILIDDVNVRGLIEDPCECING